MAGSLYNPDFTAITVNTPQVRGAVEFVLELRDGLGVVGGSIDNVTVAMVTNSGNHGGLKLEQTRPDMNFFFTSMPPGPLAKDRSTLT